MNNYWSYCLYPLFLSTLSSCTLASISDQELQDQLDNLALLAVAKFKFPKIKLDFEYDDAPTSPYNPTKKGYKFVNQVTYKELQVIVAWMKVYWLEYQLSREKNYENLYVDKDVKAFSSANLISNIEKTYSTFLNFAKQSEDDYSRVNAKGRPAIGDVNVEI